MTSKSSSPASSVCHATEQRLREAGIQTTPQRLQIADLLFERGGHLSALELFESINRHGPGVCRATVYNTLNLLAERGLVREICLDGGRTMYDTNTAPHHHLYNVDTGELTDVPPAAVAFRRLPALPEDTRREDIDLIVRIRNQSPSPRKPSPDDGSNAG